MKLAVLAVFGVLAWSLPATADPGELFPDAKGSTRTPVRPTPLGPGPVPAVDPYPAIGRPTPAQMGAAAQQARKTITDYATKNKLRLVEIPTDHFMIFSDCGRENDKIARALESAYAALTRALGMGAGDAPFVGPLPVVVLADRASLRPFADRDGIALGEGAIGYYADAAENPFSHVVMAYVTPGEGDAGEEARKAWNAALARELTRAVLARHKTARPLPAWVVAGLAEHAAATPVSEEDAAKPRPQVKALLTANPLAAEQIPASGKLVELLLTRDGKAFAELVRLLKTGTPVATALDRCFKLTEAKLEALWVQIKTTPAAPTAGPTTGPAHAAGSAS